MLREMCPIIVESRHSVGEYLQYTHAFEILYIMDHLIDIYGYTESLEKCFYYTENIHPRILCKAFMGLLPDLEYTLLDKPFANTLENVIQLKSSNLIWSIGYKIISKLDKELDNAKPI